MLKARIITALALLPLVLGGIFLLPTWAFSLAMGVAVLLGAWEWARLVNVERQSSRWAWLGAAVMLMGVIGGGWVEPGRLLLPALVLGAGWWLFAGWQVLRFAGESEPAGPFRVAGALTAGLLVLIPAWTGLVWLHGLEGGPWLVLMVLVITWAADVGAYFAGRALGRRKLAPRVSPGKTWEGAIGGVLLALLAALVMYALFPIPPLPLGGMLLLVAVTVVFSVFGDLYESLVKRRRGVKDSGTLLPGHGGVLDRIDSLTATATVFALGVYLMIPGVTG